MPNKAAKKDRSGLGQRQQRIYDFLRGNHAGVLATVDPNGEPHATVVYHTVDEQFVVSFLTRTCTKKYDNVVRNNHVILVVFEPASQTVAQVIGKAVEVTDAYEINGVAEAVFEASLGTNEENTPPVAKLHAGDYAAFRILPDQIRMAVYASPDAGDRDNIFESIESFELKDSGS
jgi:uncharacterized pyridoxamine 5'-phosphate oxidase family protein